MQILTLPPAPARLGLGCLLPEEPLGLRDIFSFADRGCLTVHKFTVGDSWFFRPGQEVFCGAHSRLL